MSTLALLRDLVGCRAVLHDANEEEHPPEMLARLKAVMDEVVAALGGGEVEHRGWSSRRLTGRPVLERAVWSGGFYWDAEEPDEITAEADYQAWRADRLHEARTQLNRDWLAWDNNTRVARGRRWNQAHPAGVFDGIDSPLAFGVDRGAGDIHAAVAAIDRLGAEPDVVWMNPQTYAQFQEQQRRVLAQAGFGPAVAARGYRPRWAPMLAAELANLLPPRHASPIPEPP